MVFNGGFPCWKTRAVELLLLDAERPDVTGALLYNMRHGTFTSTRGLPGGYRQRSLPVPFFTL